MRSVAHDASSIPLHKHPEKYEIDSESIEIDDDFEPKFSP